MSSGNGNTRWVLGFDGGCITCTALALRIEALSGSRLTARNLREPEVQVWRTQTLGPDAPWTPALFAVSESGVRAFRRMGMALSLSRLLGPAKMWQIARLLGERDVPTDEAFSPARRRFLKTVGGAAFGLAILSGMKAFSPLSAAGAGQTTIKLADPQVRAKMLKQASKDDGIRLLSERLRKDGFKVTKEPSVFVVQEGERVLRTAVITEYGAAGGVTATLGFSIESNGQPLTLVLVAKDGELSYGLRVNSAGAIETITPDVTALAVSCGVCVAICNIGGCAIGCIPTAFLFCGAGAFICSQICRSICSLGAGVPCELACTQLQYCP